MAISDTTLSALISALVIGVPAFFTGLASLVVAWRYGDRSSLERASLSAQIGKIEAKTDTVVNKAVEIHTLSNSQLMSVTAELKTANERIIGLEKLLVSNKIAPPPPNSERT